MYLLDANALIDANRDYYPIKRVPEFWEWLLHNGRNGKVKIPVEIYGEIADGKDDLAVWIKQDEAKNSLLLNEEVNASLVTRVTEEGYANDLSESEVILLGKDPFLIAYALKEIHNRIVVTTEGSKPTLKRANRKVPDVCNQFQIKTIHMFGFVKELDFNTRWDNTT